MNRKQLKILWMSNAPFVPTGYGTVTKNVCYRLLKYGFNVATVNYYGTEGTMLTLDGLRQYPKAFDPLGKDAAQFAIADFNPHLFITLFDCWVGYDWLDRLHQNWIPYVPIDHEPVPPPVSAILEKAYQIVSMSHYGWSQLRQIGLDNICIPHGVDTKVFHEMTEQKQACKVWLNQFSKGEQFSKHQNFPELTENDFIVGINSRNHGTRKDIPRMLIAFKEFLNQNPDAKKDAKLYLHTWIRGMEPYAFHLDDMLADMGLLEYVRWTPLLKMHCGVAEDQLKVIYNAMDIFLNLSQGEGFGIPIIEAEACGVPCIVSDFTSMPELVRGHGWLAPVLDKHYTPLNSQQCTVDPMKTADMIGEAYNSPSKTELYGKSSRDFAVKEYDYDSVILPKWVDFLDSLLLNYATNYELKPIEVKA